MNSKRLNYLDMAKGIGMLLVLLGHLQGDAIYTLSEYFQPMCVWIFSFHMPLFFIVSGILINHTYKEEVPLSVHFKKRFKSIMIPYYLFSICYLSVVVYALITGSIAKETLFVNLWYVISLYGMNVLWFLPAIFLGELLFLLLRKRLSGKSFVPVVIVLSAVAFVIAYFLPSFTFGFDPEMDVQGVQGGIVKRITEFITVILRPVIACGFITIGYYVHEFCIKNARVCRLRDILTEMKLAGKAIYIVIGLVLLGACVPLSKVNNGIDFRSVVFRNVFFFMLCALLGSFGLILLCKGLPKMRLIMYWGTGSLIFMAVHNSETILYYALKASMFLNQYLTHARGYICYAVIVGIILVYTTLMIYVINRFFPFMVGKRRKKQ